MKSLSESCCSPSSGDKLYSLFVADVFANKTFLMSTSFKLFFQKVSKETNGKKSSYNTLFIIFSNLAKARRRTG
jgi:hypothetical protein